MTRPLLEVEHLRTYFPVRGGVFLTAKAISKAVDDVSFSIAAGETLGLVGESGCGKSTLAKTVVRLLKPAGGAVRFEGTDLIPLVAARAQALPPQHPDDLPGPRRLAQLETERGQAAGGAVRHPRPRRWPASGASGWRACSRRWACRRAPPTASRSSSRAGSASASASRARSRCARSWCCATSRCRRSTSRSRARSSTCCSTCSADSHSSYLFVSHDLAVVKHVSDRIRGHVPRPHRRDRRRRRGLPAPAPSVHARAARRGPGSRSAPAAAPRGGRGRRARRRSTRPPAATSIRAARTPRSGVASSPPALREVGRGGRLVASHGLPLRPVARRSLAAPRAAKLAAFRKTHFSKGSEREANSARSGGVGVGGAGGSGQRGVCRRRLLRHLEAQCRQVHLEPRPCLEESIAKVEAWGEAASSTARTSWAPTASRRATGSSRRSSTARTFRSPAIRMPTSSRSSASTPNTIKSVSKLKGKVTLTVLGVVSSDGKTRTLTQTRHNAQGAVVKNVLVFERQKSSGPIHRIGRQGLAQGGRHASHDFW